jgi:hypothetical protein
VKRALGWPTCKRWLDQQEKLWDGEGAEDEGHGWESVLSPENSHDECIPRSVHRDQQVGWEEEWWQLPLKCPGSQEGRIMPWAPAAFVTSDLNKCMMSTQILAWIKWQFKNSKGFFGEGWVWTQDSMLTKQAHLLVEPVLQSILVWLFRRLDLENYLFRMAWNLNPPDISHQTRKDNWCEE